MWVRIFSTFILEEKNLKYSPSKDNLLKNNALASFWSLHSNLQ